MKVKEFLESEEFRVKKSDMHERINNGNFTDGMVLTNINTMPMVGMWGMLEINEVFRNAFNAKDDFHIVIDFDHETQRIEIKTYMEPDADFKEPGEYW